MKICGYTALVLLTLLLSGCGAHFNSIYRSTGIDEDTARITTVDAKQRAIFYRNSKFCSEPSPDVFSVYAQAFSGEAAVGKKADPKTLDARLAAALSTAEQGSTISRTQTINLIRESLFHTCMRSLNDDIEPFEMSIQAARDQRAMISILAIEQLTGAIALKPVVIAASSNAAVVGAAELAVRLDEAGKELQAADTTLKTKRAALNKLDKEDPTCKDIAAKVSQGTALQAAETEKQTACKQVSAEVTDADEVQKKANERYMDLKKLSEQGIGLSAGSKTSEEVSAVELKVDPVAITNVAVVAAVTNIVTQNMNLDEVKFFCIKLLSSTSREAQAVRDNLAGSEEELNASCSRYLLTEVLSAQVAREASLTASQMALVASQRALVQTQTDTAAERIREHTDDTFERFWAAVADAGNADAANKEKLAKRVTDVAKSTGITAGADQLKLDRLKQARTKNEARAAFGKLSSSLKDLLSQTPPTN